MAEDKPEKIKKSDAQWQAQLSPEEFHICRLKGTERAFTGALYTEKRAGTYLCKCCGEALFGADAKYDSGCGWPSFFQPADANKIDEYRDTSHGMIRTEVCCSRCDAHLGHLFPDGPAPTGIRYCINSASLSFVPEDK